MMGDFPPNIPSVSFTTTDEGGDAEVFELSPNSPRAKRLYDAFRREIQAHVLASEGKTLEEFADALALDLWKITRT